MVCISTAAGGRGGFPIAQLTRTGKALDPIFLPTSRRGRAKKEEEEPTRWGIIMQLELSAESSSRETILLFFFSFLVLFHRRIYCVCCCGGSAAAAAALILYLFVLNWGVI